MSRHKKDPLRVLREEEREQLVHLSRSQAAPADQVARAKALLCVPQGMNYSTAAQHAGRVSGSAAVGSTWPNPSSAFSRRALASQHPRSPQEIMSWLEATARAWNREPTPFVWSGKRHTRRHPQKTPHLVLSSVVLQPIGGSGACNMGLA